MQGGSHGHAATRGQERKEHTEGAEDRCLPASVPLPPCFLCSLSLTYSSSKKLPAEASPADPLTPRPVPFPCPALKLRPAASPALPCPAPTALIPGMNVLPLQCECLPAGGDKDSSTAPGVPNTLPQAEAPGHPYLAISAPVGLPWLGGRWSADTQVILCLQHGGRSHSVEGAPPPSWPEGLAGKEGLTPGRPTHRAALDPQQAFVLPQPVLRNPVGTWLCSSHAVRWSGELGKQQVSAEWETLSLSSVSVLGAPCRAG